MSGLYTLKVITHFAAAHTLAHYAGACKRMHGHNWKVETEVEGQQLDNAGMLIDFKTIRRASQEVAAGLDHRYINEIAPFDALNPTAEHIARWFFQQLSTMLNTDTTRIKAVTLWETEFACARYTEDA